MHFVSVAFVEPAVLTICWCTRASSCMTIVWVHLMLIFEFFFMPFWASLEFALFYIVCVCFFFVPASLDSFQCGAVGDSMRLPCPMVLCCRYRWWSLTRFICSAKIVVPSWRLLSRVSGKISGALFGTRCLRETFSWLWMMSMCIRIDNRPEQVAGNRPPPMRSLTSWGSFCLIVYFKTQFDFAYLWKSSTCNG